MRLLLPLLATAAITAAEPSYTLHEWGVFTINPGNPFAQQDYRDEWASFPAFFTKQPPLPQAAKPGVVVRKPVVFLQADSDQVVDLAFTLRGGTPLVWWPEAVAVGETLRFTVQVLDKQAERSASPDMSFPPVPAGHWIEHLRAVDSDYVKPVPTGERRKNPSTGPTGDSFLYYDGLLPAMATPTLVFAGADKHPTWTVTNTAAYPMLDVVLVWNSADGEVRESPWVEAIAPGASASVPLWPKDTTTNRDATRMPLPMQLEQRLAATGLSKAEATSLVACWKDGLFAHDGMTLIYRLPQEAYEHLLPLTATPKPKQSIRVGLVVHQHLEPTLAADVNALINTLTSVEPERQPAVYAKLKAYGGAAIPLLRARCDGSGPVAAKCRLLLAELDLIDDPSLKGLGTGERP